MIFMCAPLLVLHHGVGEQRDVAAALDGGGHLALVPRAVPRDAAGHDLAPLGDEVLELGRVLVVHLEALVRAVPAHLAPAESASAAALLAHPAAALAPVARAGGPSPVVLLESVPVHVRLLAVARLFGFRLGADLALRLAPLAAEAALLAERLRPARSALRHLRVAGQLHVGLHLARGRVDLVGQLHRLVLEHVVGHAQVALELRHHVRVPQVDEPDVDGAEVLLHLVRDLLLAPVLHLDDLAAFALHDAAQALDDLVHQVLGQVGPQEEDGLVLAQLRSRRVLRRPSAGLRLCLLHVLYLLGLPEVPPPARSTFSCASPFSPPASVGRRLNRFIAAAVPSRSAATAASAATGTISSTTASSSAANLASTKSAGSHPCGGRPMPDRTRTKSGPRCCRRLFSPLGPPSPPPIFTWMRPSARSRSSCATTNCPGSTFQNRTACPTDSPDTFMNVWGSTIAICSPRTLPVPSTAFQRVWSSATPSFAAASRAMRNPRLWRVRSYFAPGLPRPTRRRTGAYFFAPLSAQPPFAGAAAPPFAGAAAPPFAGAAAAGAPPAAGAAPAAPGAAPGAPGAAAPGAPGTAAPGTAPSAPGTAAAGAGATSSFSGMFTTAMVAFLITLVLKRTPSGGLMSEMWIDSAILRFETSTSIFSGIWPGLQMTGSVRLTCCRMPPSVTPTGLPISTTGTLTTTSWSIRTSRKSTWRMCPSTGSFS